MFSITLSTAFLYLIAIIQAGNEKPIFSDEIKEIIQIVHDECVEKTGVTEEDITNCENGIFKEDVKLKCYMFCLLEEASLVDDEGVVDYDMLISLVPDAYHDRASHMLLSCKHLDTPDKDKCQRAFDVHKCSYEKDPDLYFLF
uniref:Odorant binding protein n=1 Tax=Dendrolimus kikuchii TaxID=765133 RepID=A0A076E947_9NEOP|nr:odorant binding protein [Dendrolimus kikuchii]